MGTSPEITLLITWSWTWLIVDFYTLLKIRIKSTKWGWDIDELVSLLDWSPVPPRWWWWWEGRVGKGGGSRSNRSRLQETTHGHRSDQYRRWSALGVVSLSSLSSGRFRRISLLSNWVELSWLFFFHFLNVSVLAIEASFLYCSLLPLRTKSRIESSW